MRVQFFLSYSTSRLLCNAESAVRLKTPRFEYSAQSNNSLVRTAATDEILITEAPPDCASPEIEALIWRRILVPVQITLPQLHDLLQLVMGWTNSHLHSFEFGERTFGMDGADLEELNMLNEKKFALDEVLGDSLREFLYEYDFGDRWPIWTRKPFGAFVGIVHHDLLNLDCPQIFGQARNQIIGAALRVRATGILIFPIKIETPYGHIPRSMGRQSLAAVDDLMDLLRRKNAAMTVSDPREVGHLNLECLRHGSIAARLVAMAAGAKSLVQLNTG